MTEAKPRISVVMCAHNEQERLPGCLEKVSFADEIIVVCDKCTDQTEEVAQKYGAKPLLAAGT